MKKVEESRYIDVRNDKIVIEMGLNRCSVLVSRDKNVWSKTSKEKRDLRKQRNMFGKHSSHFHTKPNVSSFRSKLIIQLKKNKLFRNTISTICFQHDIPSILSKYGDKVKHYFWNGYKYSVNELPYKAF